MSGSAHNEHVGSSDDGPGGSKGQEGDSEEGQPAASQHEETLSIIQQMHPTVTPHDLPWRPPPPPPPPAAPAATAATAPASPTWQMYQQYLSARNTARSGGQRHEYAWTNPGDGPKPNRDDCIKFDILTWGPDGDEDISKMREGGVRCGPMPGKEFMAIWLREVRPPAASARVHDGRHRDTEGECSCASPSLPDLTAGVQHSTTAITATATPALAGSQQLARSDDEPGGSEGEDGDSEEVARQKRISHRQKQIIIGKNTPGYQNYRRTVKREHRTAADPMTPDANKACSKTRSDREFGMWRRALHRYDNVPLDGGHCQASTMNTARSAGRHGATGEPSTGLPPLLPFPVSLTHASSAAIPSTFSPSSVHHGASLLPLPNLRSAGVHSSPTHSFSGQRPTAADNSRGGLSGAATITSRVSKVGTGPKPTHNDRILFDCTAWADGFYGKVRRQLIAGEREQTRLLSEVEHDLAQRELADMREGEVRRLDVPPGVVCSDGLYVEIWLRRVLPAATDARLHDGHGRGAALQTATPTPSSTTTPVAQHLVGAVGVPLCRSDVAMDGDSRQQRHGRSASHSAAMPTILTPPPQAPPHPGVAPCPPCPAPSRPAPSPSPLASRVHDPGRASRWCRQSAPEDEEPLSSGPQEWPTTLDVGRTVRVPLSQLQEQAAADEDASQPSAAQMPHDTYPQPQSPCPASNDGYGHGHSHPSASSSLPEVFQQQQQQKEEQTRAVPSRLSSVAGLLCPRDMSFIRDIISSDHHSNTNTSARPPPHRHGPPPPHAPAANSQQQLQQQAPPSTAPVVFPNKPIPSPHAQGSSAHTRAQQQGRVEHEGQSRGGRLMDCRGDGGGVVLVTGRWEEEWEEGEDSGRDDLVRSTAVAAPASEARLVTVRQLESRLRQAREELEELAAKQRQHHDLRARCVRLQTQTIDELHDLDDTLTSAIDSWNAAERDERLWRDERHRLEGLLRMIQDRLHIHPADGEPAFASRRQDSPSDSPIASSAYRRPHTHGDQEPLSPGPLSWPTGLDGGTIRVPLPKPQQDPQQQHGVHEEEEKADMRATAVPPRHHSRPSPHVDPQIPSLSPHGTHGHSYALPDSVRVPPTHHSRGPVGPFGGIGGRRGGWDDGESSGSDGSGSWGNASGRRALEQFRATDGGGPRGRGQGGGHGRGRAYDTTREEGPPDGSSRGRGRHMNKPARLVEEERHNKA
ncbi:unnamed protein product [Vitrella brassicaformis CCMP3155]|uniref:Histone RNA hairpin-binding protein RNA-binding domain-containing protein n=1 Tax=Vitrella brassicaformis (strain CCMP3155) TaxID=1169540 RepID=A0A0G4EBD5_VITBC|nr:unnamed protein product [Vitrella brassicaformis CCMP3155]|eukprot:CEL92816.1 unnamed protein product [Vitrella brassicaformis CCMP3155]